jgi:putative Mg2+ transporter-C (MgtC) family protein
MAQKYGIYEPLVTGESYLSDSVVFLYFFMNETFDSFLALATPYGSRLLASIIAGAVIGMEGEMYEKPAGLRTNILISLGSAIFTIISIVGAQTYGGESSRIAAQIVTGIGFLGAGVIMHYRFHIQGITTAATIYANAAIGITIGYGHIFSGVGIALVIFFILVLLRPLDAVIDRSKLISKIRKRDALRQEKRRQAELSRIIEEEHQGPSL